MTRNGAADGSPRIIASPEEPMGTFQFFAVESELTHLIEEVAADPKHILLLEGAHGRLSVASPASISMAKCAYLCPLGLAEASTENELSGCLRIIPGARVDAANPVLTMTTIDTLRKSDPEAEKLLRRTKLIALRLFQGGVDAVNLKTGGKGTYRNICYSKEAEKLFRLGVQWKQFASDNAAYRPAAAPPSK